MKKKILYIHGLSSSGATSTASAMRELLPQVTVISPDVPLPVRAALPLLHEICRIESPDIVIGSSMGGMFAQQMYGYKKVLVNPAFHVSEIMRQKIGVQPFLNPRKDGATHYEITSDLCEQYEEMEKHQFEGITDFDRDNTYALFGNRDTLVNGYDEFLQYYIGAFSYSGEHKLSYEDIRDVIVEIIKRLI